ncbi:hypothetical protein [Phenylobacterium sp. NIBR 498073]|uniref:hypothetical protein n=1 Tax=Phenylobacterium sp. NIBR 498073 TaxID=3015177 RepID=UPI0022B52B59|nr:hypothetical protein [Phenylobacterium sp. NIBR 498073]WGU40924.1 hypothetical protein O4N75_04160 [Phenylobacterium sp. NIBR 498073]
MAGLLDPAAALNAASKFVDKKRREAAGTIATVKGDLAQMERQLKGQVAAAVLKVAHDPKTPPGVARQALRLVPELVPKKAPSAKATRPVSAPTSKPKAAAAPTLRERIDENLGRAGAFVNGAGDAATLGLANHLMVIQQMRQGAGIGLNPIENYKHLLGLQEAQDLLEKEKYPLSRGAGSVVGTVAPLILSGGASAAPQGFTRIAPHAVKGIGWGGRALVKRFVPQAGASLASGGVSAATQVLVDAADPRREVNPADTVGALVGGMAGGLTTLYGGVRSGAISDAVATELTRAALRGERPSIEAMGQSAVAGVYLGKVGGDAANRWSRNLPASKYYKRGRRISKEEIGEKLSETKSRLHGERIVGRQGRMAVSGGHTKPDHISAGAFSRARGETWPRESKFGFFADLKPRQKEAERELAGYRVDHFTPDDFGRIVGGALASSGGQIVTVDR